MVKYQFGNFEVEIDPTDVAFVEKYEVAAENYQNKVKSMSTDGKASETMKSVCEIFFETFDDIFGAGTSKQMFGEANSVDLCVKAFKALVEIMNDYSETLKSVQLVATSESRRKRKK